ncbi:putative ultraviolet-B receptor UVR8 [Blattamonas nauphoetae]|uniref:Ultraviolet-B receptor UVR8 n=1 Tax=Blattamonas nauphoetae TaxID=2049346 RepID=A0ABQ9YI36_9EUKA|nr:putative ultraviolet-B receptor UVR8 [Blattamonas nauphoetae]
MASEGPGSLGYPRGLLFDRTEHYWVPFISDTSSNFVAVATCTSYSAAGQANGRIIALIGTHGDFWISLPNSLTEFEPVVIPGFRKDTQFVDVRAGEGHLIALTAQGNLISFGSNNCGQCGVKAGLHTKKARGWAVLPHFSHPAGIVQSSLGHSKISSIHTQYYHCCVILENGAVFVWGDNSSGQLGINKSSGKMPDVIELTDKSLFPSAFNGEQIISFSGGWQHSLFLSKEGHVFVAGDNGAGQLGLSKTVQQLDSVCVPTLIPPAAFDNVPIVTIGTGGDHSAVITAKGDCYVWGYNDENQLGFLKNPLTHTQVKLTNCITPIKLPRFSQDAEAYHDLALAWKSTLLVTKSSRVYVCGEWFPVHHSSITDDQKIDLIDRNSSFIEIRPGTQISPFVAPFLLKQKEREKRKEKGNTTPSGNIVRTIGSNFGLLIGFS